MIMRQLFAIVLCATIFAVGVAQADFVAVGNSSGGVEVFNSNGFNSLANNCCFINEGATIDALTWLDQDHLAIGANGTGTTTDVTIRQPLNAWFQTGPVGGVGAQINSFAAYNSAAGDFFISTNDGVNLQIRDKFAMQNGDPCCGSLGVGAGGIIDSTNVPSSLAPEGATAFLHSGDRVRLTPGLNLPGAAAPFDEPDRALGGIEIGTAIATLADGNIIVGKTDVDLSPGGGGVSRFDGETLGDMGGNCCHPDPVLDVAGLSDGRGAYITSGPVANGELILTDFAGGNVVFGGGLNNSSSGLMTTMAVLSDDSVVIGYETGDIQQFGISGTTVTPMGVVGNVGSSVASIAVVVPEPASLGLLLVGVLALLRRRS